MRTTSNAIFRGISALLLTVLVVRTVPVGAAPGDIFTIPAPILGADPPKGAELGVGDVSVATKTGAASYSYPIKVPPGRNGMAPQLALSYSSQAPTYGGVAVGWQLPVGMISEDTSDGRLRTHDPRVEATETDAKADDRFVSSIAGDARLVAVTEPALGDVYRTYRVAHGDATFARYERLHVNQPARWRVRQTDGSVMLFGESANAPNCALDDGYAPLTRVTDAFGNEVKYEYVLANRECMLSRVTWGQNPTAGIPSFAELEVKLQRAPVCSGFEVGSLTSYRSGRAVATGTNQITSFVIKAKDPNTSTTVHTRVITLGYSDQSCTAAHAPIRLLESIQESASGIDAPNVDLPAVTFEYGDPTVNLNTLKSQSNPMNGLDPRPHNLGWGKRYNDDRWPTVEAMLVDVDGDGLQDRLMNASTARTNGQCKARWQKNLGPNQTTGLPTFGATATFDLPRLKWAGGSVATGNEGCSLNGQATQFVNSEDGATGICHDRVTPCGDATDPQNDTDYCDPTGAGTKCPHDEATGPSLSRRTWRIAGSTSMPTVWWISWPPSTATSIGTTSNKATSRRSSERPSRRRSVHGQPVRARWIDAARSIRTACDKTVPPGAPARRIRPPSMRVSRWPRSSAAAT